MMLSDALYSLFSDELARQAEITIETGSAVSTYGVERLVDDNPAHLFRANETSVALQLEFAEKTPIGLLALIHGTPESDDDVRVQGDDGPVPDWDSPAFDIAFPQSGWVGSGVTRWPVNSWINVSEQPDYDPLGYKFYRLAFGITSPLAQALELGQIRMHPPPVLSLALDRDMLERRSKPRINNTTAFEVETKYSRGTTIWRASIRLTSLFDSDGDERAAIQNLWSDVDGGNHPWLFIPDATEAPCYLVCFAGTDEEIQRVVKGVSNRAGDIREVGRGLRPGD